MCVPADGIPGFLTISTQYVSPSQALCAVSSSVSLGNKTVTGFTKRNRLLHYTSDSFYTRKKLTDEFK